jgi:hypothetical protein
VENPQLSILSRHNILALSPQNNITTLQQIKQPQFTPQTGTSPLDVLANTYPQDAALVQYNLRTTDGVRVPIIPRLAKKSLSELDNLTCSMEWLILDWDLNCKGVPWGAPEKSLQAADVREFVTQGRYDFLQHAYAIYLSKSGIRVVYALSVPLILRDQQDVDVWKEFYGRFLDWCAPQITASPEFNIGKLDPDKLDPFTLNRVPNYEAVRGEMIYHNPSARLEAQYISREDVAVNKSSNSQERKSYEKPDVQQAMNALYNDPFMTHLRESGVALSYPDWRALGTNIAAIFEGDTGKEIFHQVSQWDASNYDPQGVENQWPHILQSVEEYGPVTWGQFQHAVDALYSEAPAPSSSLAAYVCRAVKNSGASTPPPSQDNFEEVRRSLYTVEKKKNGVLVHVPTKCIPNLMTILRTDNRWGNALRRNHLGSIDMLHDRPLRDEDITAMRETISRIYGLNYSKDDMFDVVKFIAAEAEYHPVCDYLSTLQWDGVDRIKDFGQTIGQTDPFAETVLRRFLISCVVRPLEWANHTRNVNWKIDTVLILKGEQGAQKSSWFKALCHDIEWFSDNLPSITAQAKDASLHMLGKWLVEQAEFENHVARSSIEAMKAFVTREREIFRKSYGRTELNMRRPSVLVGTTNSSNFLNDPTGDRRYWVLAIPETHKINLAWVRNHRDQLWAQAVHLYRNGESWWLSATEDTQRAEENQKFRRPSALNEAILEFLNSSPTMANLRHKEGYLDGIGFTLKQLVSVGLDKKLADIKSSEAHAITLYLNKMGWDKIRTRVENQRMYVFRKRVGVNDGEVF